MSKADGQRELRFGDRVIRLRFSIRALAELEDRWEVKGIQGVMQRAANPGARDLVDIFYAVTRSHHADELTYEECMELLDGEGISGLTTAVLGAISDSADEASGEEAEGEGKPNPAT